MGMVEPQDRQMLEIRKLTQRLQELENKVKKMEHAESDSWREYTSDRISKAEDRIKELESWKDKFIRWIKRKVRA